MNIEQLKEMGRNTMVDAIGIELTEIGENFVSGKMPVDHRTVQPFGLLHGGASAAFAETLGSVAGMLAVDSDRYRVVGKSLNCRHLRSVKEGWVFGRADAVALGENEQVWAIEIRDEDRQTVCSCRLTLAVIK
jgi:1,4-dihydroxy-2-naphthoyl-CoA hydrolase